MCQAHVIQPYEKGTAIHFHGGTEDSNLPMSYCWEFGSRLGTQGANSKVVLSEHYTLWLLILPALQNNLCSSKMKLICSTNIYRVLTCQTPSHVFPTWMSHNPYSEDYSLVSKTDK